MTVQQINHKITALFMGEIDLETGIWFPIKKMTWNEKKKHNYLNCKIEFVEGANQYQRLHPQWKNLFMPRDTNKVMQFQDVLSCSWRNRMPVSRPVDEKLKICLGLSSTNAVDPVEFVARDGGYRHGDRQNLFPEIAPDERKNYNFIFRSIDSWVISSDNRQDLENTVVVGDEVTPVLFEDFVPVSLPDSSPLLNAIPESIRMKLYVRDKFVGYAPFHIKELYKDFGEALKIEVYQKNLGVPFEYQFLFLASLNHESGVPFSAPKYQPVNSSIAV